ncbi:hypothetical protein KI387_015456, partial [Taxus chinensis]
MDLSVVIELECHHGELMAFAKKMAVFSHDKNAGRTRFKLPDLAALNSPIKSMPLWWIEIHETAGEAYNHLCPPNSSTYKPSLDEGLKERYTAGAIIVEKLGFTSGGLGSRGQGIWIPPKVRSTKVFDSLCLGASPSKKGPLHTTTSTNANPVQFTPKSNPQQTVQPHVENSRGEVGHEFVTIAKVEQFTPANTFGFGYRAEFINTSERDKRNKKQILQATGTSDPTTMRVLPTYNLETNTLEYMYVVPKVVKLKNEMLPTNYDVTSLQIELKAMKPSDKINVSERNNDLLYTTLLKAERENNKLNNKIQNLEADLENEKAKGKVVINKTSELERRIKSPTSMTTRIFDKLREYVTGNRKVMDLREDTTNKILEVIYKFSDTELTSRGIQNRFDALIKGSNMRRRPGISGLKTAAAARDQYKLLGENVAKLRTDLMKEQLSTFRTQLEDFARKHKNDIKKNPAFRSQFHEMCAKVGVDPLASNKGFWAELLGIGDFYYELGVQIVDICLATRPHNGGLIELRELQALLSKRRRSSREAISEDDCIRAISKLKALGSGFEVYSVGKKKLVRSVPTELNKDHNEILEMAQVRGYVMAEEVERKLGWSSGRATDTLETLLKEGLAMIDDGHPD